MANTKVKAPATSKHTENGKAKKDKRGGKDSTDRWTSNGYGLKSEPVSAERKARIAKINKELAEGKKSQKKER